MSEGRRPNRLASSTSPYLLQHANNPVDWYPWGDEALARARAEDRPLLLSIGYAACHWCHVMERESFEDEDVARRMNEHFVCIKVDREERPDVDDVYMAATVAMSGGGGWPMTVFCAPDGRPFFAGTYFPPRASHGRPGFADLLEKIAAMWSTDRDALLAQADELTRHLAEGAAPARPAAVPVEAIDLAVRQLDRTFDATWGGFGGAPKFPPGQSLRLLLRHHVRTGNARSLEMARVTLDRMARGGLHDHLGGGFARYSTDARWHVPHFEKMLYDNAQLARVYLEAFQITGDVALRAVVDDTLGWMASDMQLSHGGFASATDADSEGVEGKYFVFDRLEIEDVLGADAADRFCTAYDVRPDGNWEGSNVLWRPRTAAEVARELGVTVEALEADLAGSRARLLEVRRARVAPLTDDKALAAWNGLAIGAFAEAGRVLGEPRWIESAVRAARFVIEQLTRPDGRLLRTHRAGVSQLAGYLEDHAFVADAFLDLYEATGDDGWLGHAERLARRLVADFGDEATGAFFQTAHDHEALLVRGREGTDGAIPSANAVAARVLARVGTHLGDASLRARAGRAIAAHGAAMRRVPRAFATALLVVEDLVEPPIEVVVAGEPGDEATRALDRVVAGTFLPNRALGRVDPGAPPPAGPRPLLEGKVIVDGRAAAYVCRDFACAAPTGSPDALRAILADAQATARAARERAVRPPLRPGRATAEGTAAAAAPLPPDATVTVAELVLGRVVLAPRPTTRDLVEVLRAGLRAGARAILVEASTARRVGAALAALADEDGIPPREGLALLARVDPGEGAGPGAMAEAIADLLEVETLDGVIVASAPSADEEAAFVAMRAAGRLGALGVGHPGGGGGLDAPLRVLALRASDAAPAPGPGAGIALGALDARRRGRPVRLDAEAPPADAPDFEEARGELAGIEQEFRATIASNLQAPPGSDLDPGALLAFAEAIAPLPAELAALDEVDTFVADALEPALAAATSALDDLPPPLGDRWRALRARHLPALGAALTALRARVGARARSDADALLRELAPHLPASLGGAAPAARALALALATPGVDLVIADVAEPASAAAIADALAAPRFDAAAARTALGA